MIQRESKMQLLSTQAKMAARNGQRSSKVVDQRNRRDRSVNVARLDTMHEIAVQVSYQETQAMNSQTSRSPLVKVQQAIAGSWTVERQHICVKIVVRLKSIMKYSIRAISQARRATRSSKLWELEGSL